MFFTVFTLCVFTCGIHCRCSLSAFTCDVHDALERHVRCENGLYVSDDHKCDGWVDCVDSQTDELNCKSPIDIAYTLQVSVSAQHKK